MTLKRSEGLSSVLTDVWENKNCGFFGRRHCINTKIMEQQKYPGLDAQVNKKQQHHQLS